MTIIARMVTRMALVRFVAVLLGITIFVLSLEAVSYSREILALQPGSAFIVLKYMAMRAPATLATFLPMSVLIALLLTLTELSLRNETVSIFAAGISPLRLSAMLIPFAIMTGGLQWLLMDRAVPYAAPVLRNWGIADYSEKKIKVGEDDPIWLRNGDDVMRAVSASRDSKSLTEVTIFRRDEKGLLLEQIEAASARKDERGWQLADVQRFDRSGAQPERIASLLYKGAMQPAAAGSRSGDPEEMTLRDISYFIANSGFGIRPVYLYQSWWHKRFAAALASFILIAMCVPLATAFRRGGGLGLMFAGGIGIGFLYFICDGVSLTLGETGILPPWLASWLPDMAFGVVAALLLLRRERLAG